MSYKFVRPQRQSDQPSLSAGGHDRAASPSVAEETPAIDLRKALEQIGRAETYAANCTVVGERDFKFAFFIVSGKILVECHSPNGRELGIEILEPGHIVGLLNLIDKRPTARAVTLKESQLIRVNVSELKALFLRRPDLCYQTLQAALSRLAKRTEQLQDLFFLTLTQKALHKVPLIPGRGPTGSGSGRPDDKLRSRARNP